jgi:DNA-binding NarL/FixJ family response regulator
MESIRVAVIEHDEWRGRGMSSVLRDAGLLSRTYRSMEELIRDGRGSDVILVPTTASSSLNDGIRRLQKVFPRARILAFGSIESDLVAAALFSAGAHGCFRLSLGAERLVEAVRHVAAGKIWGSREALIAAVHRNGRHSSEDFGLEADDFRLLSLLEAGMTNKEIGQRLGFAESTVKSKFNRLYKRFGVGSRVELLTTAMRKGILSSREP